MKLIKVGDLWYSTHEGVLRSSNELHEDIVKWNIVTGLPRAAATKLESEFGSVVKGIQAADTQTTASNILSPGTHVKEIALEDSVRVAKFDSWHAAAAAKISS